MSQTEQHTNINLGQIFISRVSPGATKQLEFNLSKLDICKAILTGVSGSILRQLNLRVPRTILMEAIGLSRCDYPKLAKRKRLTSNQTDSLNELTKIWAELLELFNFKVELLTDWLEHDLPILPL